MRTARRQKAGLLRATTAVLAVMLIAASGLLLFSYLRLARLREDCASSHAALISRYNKGTEQLKEWIKKYSMANNIHPAFVAAVVYCESTYDPYAVSSAGARGLMQIMEDTASWIAEKLGDKDYSFVDMFDPETNIRYGTWYIAYLSSIFDGDPVKVASAYHAGKSNVEIWMMNYTSDGFTLTMDDIPMRDTKDYTGKVLDTYAIYLREFYKDNA